MSIRARSTTLLAVLACAFSLFRVTSQAQIYGVGTGNFTAGFTLDGCSGVGYWVHVSGVCTAQYRDGTGTVQTYTDTVNDDRLLVYGFNGIFNGAQSYAWIHVNMQNVTVTPFSGCGSASGNTQAVLPWLDQVPLGTTRQGGAPLGGPNYVGFARPWTDCTGSPDTGCGSDLTVQYPNYTNNTGSPQSITGLPGQTGQYILQPGQGLPPQLVPFTSGGNLSWGFQTSPVVPQSTQPDGSPISGGSFTNVGGILGYLTNVNNDIFPGNNSPTGNLGGVYASFLDNPSNVSGPIIWDNGSGGALAQDSTLKAGFSALLNGLQQQAHGVITNAFAVNVLVTNVISTAGATNIFNGSSNVWVENWPTNNLVARTNGIDESGTNFYAGIDNSVTNWTIVAAKGVTAFQPLSDAISPVAAMTAPVVGSADGYSQDINVTTGLGTFTFGFDTSDATWSPVYTFMRILSEWVLLISYVLAMGNEIWHKTKAVLGQQGIHIQPVQLELLGTGGNLAGIGLMGTMIAVTFTAIAGFITLIAGLVSNAFAGSGGVSALVTSITSNPFTGSAAVLGGVHILIACFPLQLFVTLLVAYVVFRYASMLIAIPLMIALRILPN